MTLKFFYNGIKDDGGKLQTCSYSAGELINYPKGTITIYKRDYIHFSAAVGSALAFVVENDSDIITDYFAKDRIRVVPNHPLYPEVKAALDKQEARRAARYRATEPTYCNCGHGAPCMDCAS